MRKKQVPPHEDAGHGPQDDRLEVGDLIRYLSGLAKLYSGGKVGNPKLSEGLRELTKALRPYMHRPVADLENALREEKRPYRRNPSPQGGKEALPPDLETIPYDRIEDIIDRKYSKVQLVELGARRFGISQSKLARLDREGVLASIRSALDHEMSLDVISRQARRGR